MKHNRKDFSNYRLMVSPSLLLPLTLFMLLFSCKHENLDVYEESDNYRNATDFIANNFELGLFSAALQRSGLQDELRGQGPFTVFAPSDAAFNQLGITRVTDFDRMNRDSLRLMMLYHILPRRLNWNDVPAPTIDNKYVNLAGKELYLGLRKGNPACPSCIPNFFYVNGVHVPTGTTQNVALANGVLHLISQVLKYKPTVQEILESQPSYSTLVAGLKHFGHWQQLGIAGNWTILAPDNAAFTAAGITPQTIMAMNPTEYHARFFGGYVAKGHIFPSDWVVLPRAGGVTGPDFSVPILGDETYNTTLTTLSPGGTDLAGRAAVYAPNGSPINSAPLAAFQLLNYKADNGVVHGITGILTTPAQAKKQ